MKIDKNRLLEYLLNGLMLLSFSFLTLIAIKALDSRFQHDTACMLFSAHLIEHFHMVPYRDFFDANLPFAYLIYAVIGVTTGYHDRGIRIEEICVLISVMLATFFALKAFGKRLAVYASLTFALYYLLAGYFISLQREFFIVILLSFTICIAFKSPSCGNWKTNLIIGGLCGLSVLIKPHTLPICALFAAYRIAMLPDSERSRKFVLKAAAVASQIGAGVLLPLLLTLTYMIATRSLAPFLDMALNYFPLYGMLDGRHRTITAGEKPGYLLDASIAMIRNGALLFPPLLGVLTVAMQPKLSDELRRKFFLLIGLALYFIVYPAFSGQFWAYHYIPYMYCSCLLGAFVFRKIDASATGMARVVPTVIQIGCLLCAYQISLSGFQTYSPTTSPREGRVDAIAAFLKKNLRSGDRVQALDWTNSVQHAMLISNAIPATYFYYDVMFYHHLSHAYPRQARARFMNELQKSRPRFIIDIPGYEKPWPSGEDTTQQFPELKVFIKENYAKVNPEKEYAIYERTDSFPRSVFP